MAGRFAIGSNKAPAPSIFDSYGNSLTRANTDYNSLQSGYGAQANLPSPTTPIQKTPYQAAQTTFAPSADTSSAIGSLKNLSATGGYSSDDINNLRARGVSPIRSAYASARMALDRNKAIQGGYSPGYGATLAKFARDQSQALSTGVQNVNATIAQNVAGNKLASSQALASAAGAEESRKAATDQANASATNRASEFNASQNLNVDEINNKMQQDEYARQLDILRNMQSLYGTSPAQAATFGNQALSAQGMQNNFGLDLAKMRQQQGQALLGVHLA